MKTKTQKYEYQYSHLAVATDCVVLEFDGTDLKVLLIKRGLKPFKGQWAFPGGFIRIDETAEECAIRELKEETNLNVLHLKQVKVFSDINRDPRERVISIVYYALVRHSEVQGGDDANFAQWFSIDTVKNMQLAFDHNKIFTEVMKLIQRDVSHEPICFELLGRQFTIPQLQLLYEKILGVEFDRRNFQKKILQLGIIEPITEKNTYCDTEHQEKLSKKDISELFGKIDKKPSFNASAPSCIANESSKTNPNIKNPNIANDQKDCIHSEEHPKVSGRRAKKWHFNRAKYDKHRKEDNLKLDF